MTVLVATGDSVLRIRPPGGRPEAVQGLGDHAPTCIAADPRLGRRAWCGTREGGVFRSDDEGRTWSAVGLAGQRVTAVAAGPAERDVVWAGTEPSAVWRSGDGGDTWERARGLAELPSSSEWAFPPRPETHHVRWIALHPFEAGRLWVAIEAGALVRTEDGGSTWHDRAPGGPRDTHELAIHPERSSTLRVAAGDGYFESEDGGGAWARPERGLEVGYLRSVAIDPGDPDVVLASAASRAHSAYVAGRADGRLYRRRGRGAWERVTRGWPDPPDTIAPLLASGLEPGELWAADERGLHRSTDGGRSWDPAATFETTPSNLRSLAVLAVDTSR